MLYGIKIHSLQKIAIPVQTKQLHRDSARQHAVGIGPQNGLPVAIGDGRKVCT